MTDKENVNLTNFLSFATYSLNGVAEKMELKLGSVMLLLSCSLQQSLWGILASVPQTNANKCKNKISSEGEPTKRVQMIRRIPARCSGWDEAWSWISNKDCRTKYILDYVELPSAVQKVDHKLEDCEEEVAARTETSDSSFADEEYLAIAFGLATVALLTLIVIIVIRRGRNRCGLCSSGPTYSSANASEREHLDSGHTAGNEYVDDECKHTEPMYEEIRDHTAAMKKLEFHDDLKPSYQNVDDGANETSDVKNMPVNGVNRRPITPSAPYEEDLQQTNRKCVPNEYSVLAEKLVQNSDKTDQVVESYVKGHEIVTEMATIESRKEFEQNDLQVGSEVGETNIDHTVDVQEKDSELPSEMAEVSKKSVSADIEDKLSQKSSHSYENLHKSGTPPGDSLATNDLDLNSPGLQEQTGDQCVNVSPSVLNSDRTSFEDVNSGNMSMPVKLVPLPDSEECPLNTESVKTGESGDSVSENLNTSVVKQEISDKQDINNAEVRC